MQAQNSMAVIGVFTNLSEAQSAVQALKRENIGTSVRLIENDFSEDFRSDSSLRRDTDSGNRSGGGMSGFFARLFGFEDEPRDLKLNSDSELYFKDSYQNKHHFVIVDACSNIERCSQILTSMGGVIEKRGSELYEQERFLTTREGSEDVSVMKLEEERLRVDKDRIQTGQVHLHKEIIEETRTIEVPVYREEIVIETRPLSGTARPGRLSSSDRDETREIRIPVSEERIRIEKEVVPREEVLVSKERIVENQTVSESVRHEEAVIEEEGRVFMKGKDKERFQAKAKAKNKYDANDHQAGL
ncbi:MAG: YsnF/AvaK domain-containing protein [Oligoflexus sp.]|nr:YsnF/AvaK domain-containing protein [Oligoflexus sp.]